MTKEEAQRWKAGALALMMVGNFALTGCSSNHGFSYKRGTNNVAEAYSDSYINSECLKNCVVAEIYNDLLDEKQLYIVKKVQNNEGTIYYYDLLNPTGVVFYEDNENNTFVKLIKTTPVLDYIKALGIGKMRYSHKDMVDILNQIEEVYEYTEIDVLTLGK